MGLLLSGPTIRALTFRRATQVPNSVTHVLTPLWADTITVRGDAQPGGTKGLSDKLSDEYGQTWLFLVSDRRADIRTNDRTTIDGAECVVLSVNPIDHLEVTLGARQPPQP